MEENKGIGDQGKVLNLSSASRAMNIKPDEDQIKKFDEYEAKASPIRYVTILLTLASFIFCIYLFYTGHWVWGIILVILTVFLGMLSFSLGKGELKKQIAYEQGLIIPAIVVDLNPIKIMALADVRSAEGQKIIWGCQTMTLSNLPNHKLIIGEKIPCVSLFGMAIKGYRRYFEPRPISWGYKNSDFIDKTVSFITSDNDLNSENEWEILSKLVHKMDSNIEREVVFFDEDLNKVEL